MLYSQTSTYLNDKKKIKRKNIAHKWEKKRIEKAVWT